MAGIRLSTAGITVNYAVETTAGTRPTAGYTKIPEIKEIPELNPAPETIETTTLEEKEYKTYVNGLKDLGGALTFTANLTVDFMDEWDALMTKFEETQADGKSMWFCIVVPGLKESLYFTGEPAALGMPGVGVSAALETSVYITPTNAPKWDTKPTTTAI